MSTDLTNIVMEFDPYAQIPGHRISDREYNMAHAIRALRSENQMLLAQAKQLNVKSSGGCSALWKFLGGYQ